MLAPMMHTLAPCLPPPVQQPWLRHWKNITESLSEIDNLGYFRTLFFPSNTYKKFGNFVLSIFEYQMSFYFYYFMVNCTWGGVLPPPSLAPLIMRNTFVSVQICVTNIHQQYIQIQLVIIHTKQYVFGYIINTLHAWIEKASSTICFLNTTISIWGHLAWHLGGT